MHKQGNFNLADITPGVWWVDKEFVPGGRGYSGYHIAVGGEKTDGHSVAFAYVHQKKAEALANAHLIASAPKMYGVLKTLEKWLKKESEELGSSPLSQYELLIEVQRAIGKAEGIEPS